LRKRSLNPNDGLRILAISGRRLPNKADVRIIEIRASKRVMKEIFSHIDSLHGKNGFAERSKIL